jgi:enoyl-CoA hydratase/carnithine racemase
MTLPMAIRVVSATAKIGFVFARRGVVMEACSSFFLPRLIGFSKALYVSFPHVQRIMLTMLDI